MKVDAYQSATKPNKYLIVEAGQDPSQLEVADKDCASVRPVRGKKSIELKEGLVVLPHKEVEAGIKTKGYAIISVG
jgi:hypothetical protein